MATQLHPLQNLPYYIPAQIIAVTLTAPGSGAIVTSSAVAAAWTFSPGTQATYRVRVFSGPTLGSTLIYDSGVVTSGAGTHTIPSGSLLDGTTYYVFVTLSTFEGGVGESEFRQFTTDFATTDNIEGLTIDVLGGDCGFEPERLPGLRLCWDAAPVIPDFEEFVRYEVRKRRAGETADTRIAQISDIDTLCLVDYQVAASVTYEYTVQWVATDGVNEFISAPQAAPTRGLVSFPWLFIHVIGDPTRFVKFYSWQTGESRSQDATLTQHVGRTARTAHFGEARNSDFSITGFDQLLKTPRIWQALRDFLDQQADAGAVLCARWGRASEMQFVVALTPGRDLLQKTYAQRIVLAEVHYSEAV